VTIDPNELLIDQVEAELELRSAEGATWTGTRLLIGLTVFAWLAVAFAYFYLREVDTQALWRPHGVTPPTLVGTLIAAFVVLGAAVGHYGRRRLESRGRADWLAAGWVTVGLGVLAAGLQIWELGRLSFQPGLSGYTSVFVGFAGFNIAFLLGGSYWLETLLAQALRHRHGSHPLDAPAGTAGDTGPGSITSRRLHRASLDGCTYFWWYMALVSVAFWLLFYIV
jgi:heme/copper-type cytochrome/quinol oxidase subunit 3